jgi:hypothetical protein
MMTDDSGEARARELADQWNQRGQLPTEAELIAAGEELGKTDWVLHYDPAWGWDVTHGDQWHKPQPERFAARAPQPRAPKGGVTIDGKFYRGGQFIPAGGAGVGSTDFTVAPELPQPHTPVIRKPGEKRPKAEKPPEKEKPAPTAAQKHADMVKSTGAKIEGKGPKPPPEPLPKPKPPEKTEFPKTKKDLDDLWMKHRKANYPGQLALEEELGLDPKAVREEGFHKTLKSALEAKLNSVPIGERIAQDAVGKGVADEMAALHKQMEAAGQTTAQLATRTMDARNKLDIATDKVKALAQRRRSKHFDKEKAVAEAKASVEALTKEWEGLVKAKTDAKAGRDDFRKQAHAKLRDLIAAPEPLEIKANGLDAHPVENVRADMKTGLDFLAGIVGRGGMADFPAFNLTHDTTDAIRRGHGSAYYRSGTHAVNMTDGSGAGTAVHEMAHGLEYNLPGAQAACKAFLEHRVGNEPLQQLNKAKPGSGYADWEKGRMDKFDAAFGQSGWYVGKEANGDATEILSMGVERLFEEPASFAAKDPEYFTFVVGVLNGRLRDNPIPE